MNWLNPKDEHIIYEALSAIADKRFDMICPKEKLESVTKSILNNHPYESPTIDVYEIDFYSKKTLSSLAFQSLGNNWLNVSNASLCTISVTVIPVSI